MEALNGNTSGFSFIQGQQLPQTLVSSGAGKFPSTAQSCSGAERTGGAGMGWEPEQELFQPKGAGLVEKTLRGHWSLAEPRPWQLPLGSRLARSRGRKSVLFDSAGGKGLSS